MLKKRREAHVAGQDFRLLGSEVKKGAHGALDIADMAQGLSGFNPAIDEAPIQGGGLSKRSQRRNMVADTAQREAQVVATGGIGRFLDGVAQPLNGIGRTLSAQSNGSEQAQRGHVPRLGSKHDFEQSF